MAVGKGRSYGVEFLARKESGRTTGWIGYTLSWSDRRFDEIDNGRRFPARYDNRHKLNIVVSHKLSEKVELTAAWTYTSGNRMTLSLESYEQAGTLTISNQYKMNNWWEPSGKWWICIHVVIITRCRLIIVWIWDLIFTVRRRRDEWASGISVFIMYIAG